MNNWQIIDNNGVIHSGTEIDMLTAWDVLTSPTKESYIKSLSDHDTYPEDKESFGELYDKYYCDNWEGDIKLIQIHNTYK